MKSISKQIYEACQYLENHPDKSLTFVADLFKIDRHTLASRIKTYQDFTFFYENKYYCIPLEEQEPVKYFVENLNCSLTEVAQKFKIKCDTIKRRMAVMGYTYFQRYSNKFNRSAFKIVNTEEQAYWLGFFLADGYINEERNFLSVKLGEKDYNHLKKLAKFFKCENEDMIKEEDYENRTNPCYSICFNSKELVSDLKKYNLFQKKSGKEKPFLFENEILYKAYLRGMIDGDGHVENGYFKYVGSLESCEFVKEYFSKFYSFKENCRYIYPYGIIYSFEVRSVKVNEILKDIYLNSSIYLDRKYKEVLSFK